MDNTPEEFAEAVAEMLDRIEGTDLDTAEDTARQAAFRRLADPFGAGVPSRVGRGFLRRHPALFGPTVP